MRFWSSERDRKSQGARLHNWQPVLFHDRLLLADEDAEKAKATQSATEAKGDAELKQAADSSRQARVVPATPGVAAPSVVPKGVAFSLSMLVI